MIDTAWITKKPRRGIQAGICLVVLGVVDVKDAPSKIFIVHESASKTTQVALKSSGSSQDIEQGRPLQIQQRSEVNLEHRQVSFYLPNRDKREILYSEIRARAVKTQGKSKLLSGPQRIVQIVTCCFRLRSNVFLIVAVKFRLHVSVVYDPVWIVESCSWTGVLS